MRLQRRTSGLELLATPLVICGIALALWIALSAAYENIRFARATDQMLAILAIVREAVIDPAVTPERATNGLYERLSHLDGMNVVPPTPTSKAYMINPWNGRMTLDVNPASKQIALNTWVPPAVCRRHVQFLGKEAALLGIRWIEVMEDGPLGATGRLIYQFQGDGKTGKIGQNAVLVGCGRQEQVILKLIFALR